MNFSIFGWRISIRRIPKPGFYVLAGRGAGGGGGGCGRANWRPTDLDFK